MKPVFPPFTPPLRRLSLLFSLLFVFLVFSSCEKEQVTPDVLSQTDENIVLASSRAAAGPQPIEPCNCFLGVTATEANSGSNGDWRVTLNYLDKFLNPQTVVVGGSGNPIQYPGDVSVGQEMKIDFNPRRSSDLSGSYLFATNGTSFPPAMTVDFRVQCDHAPGGDYSGSYFYNGNSDFEVKDFPKGTLDFNCIARFVENDDPNM